MIYNIWERHAPFLHLSFLILKSPQNTPYGKYARPRQKARRLMILGMTNWMKRKRKSCSVALLMRGKEKF